MKTKLIQFDIYGLYGNRNYSIHLQDNKAIIVGENGSGKTTVIKILYYTLSCDWDSLYKMQFNRIVMSFSNGHTIEIKSKFINDVISDKNIERINYYFDGSPSRHRNRNENNVINTALYLRTIIENGEKEKLNSAEILMPFRFFEEAVNKSAVKKLYSISNEITKYFEDMILYLPTYRRIEEQIKNIFPNIDKEGWRKAKRIQYNTRSEELVEFGMEDVEKAVNEYQSHLKDLSRDKQNNLTLEYLSEIIDKKYEKVEINSIQKLKDIEITEILKRIHSGILSDAQKKEINYTLINIKERNETTLSENEKIICHYFLKLVNFDREMREEEERLLKFVDICNKYLVNNEIIYDKQSFTCKLINIRDKQSAELKFQDLSSGEKQIVSIFSYLNLSNNPSVFVFIDEPELSLSVDWQRMLLVDIVESANCSGLIATTHSPFVFENDLEQYVHGISEYRVKGK